jgi:LruC domain-containing protein
MYKGNGNRPWALVIFEETAQTEEKVDFTEAYLKFPDWALSSGGSYNDWYQDKSDYRGSGSKFYTK